MDLLAAVLQLCCLPDDIYVLISDLAFHCQETEYNVALLYYLSRDNETVKGHCVSGPNFDGFKKIYFIQFLMFTANTYMLTLSYVTSEQI